MAQERPRLSDDDLLLIVGTEDAALRERRMNALRRDERRRVAELQRDRETSMLERSFELLSDLGLGVGKFAGSAAIGAGEMVAPALRRIPGVSDLVATPAQFEQAQDILSPQTTGETVGRGAAEIASLLIPGGAINRARASVPAAVASRLGPRAGRVARGIAPSAIEAGVAGTEAAILGSDPETAAILASLMPLGGRLMRRGAGALERSAQRDVGQSLQPRTTGAKKATQDLTDEFLARSRRGEIPVGGNERLLERATAKRSAAGQAIGTFEDTVLPSRPDINVQSILAHLDDEIARGSVTTRAGQTVMVDAPKVQRLQGVRTLIAEFGDTVDQVALRQLRVKLDDIARRGKGAFVDPEGVVSREAYDAGATAIRRILNTANPDMATLNREFAFWKSLEDILSEGELRGVGSQGGLFSAGVGGLLAGGILPSVAGAGGAAAGAAIGSAGGVGGAIGGGASGFFISAAIGRRLIQAWRSPLWQRVNMRAKDRLAQAIMSGDERRINASLGRIFSVEFPRLTDRDQD